MMNKMRNVAFALPDDCPIINGAIDNRPHRSCLTTGMSCPTCPSLLAQEIQMDAQVGEIQAR